MSESFDAYATATLYTDASTGQLTERSYRVRVVGGPDSGAEATIEVGTLMVGTHPNNDLVLTDDTVSRYHLELQHRTEIPGVLEAVLQSPHGGSRIQLAQHLDNTEPIDMGTAMWKIYVNTSDCKRLYQRAIDAGCESEMEPQDLDRWPVTVAFVKDFDGYLIEFVEHHEGTRPGVPDPKAG